MTAFQYPWGKMRPKTFRSTLRRQQDENASLRAAATAAYHRVLEQLDRKDQRIQRQLEFLDKVTSDGKYNSQIANSLLSNSPYIFRQCDQADDPIQSDSHVLRKSRAKIHMTMNTIVDIMRGVGPMVHSTETGCINGTNTALQSSPCLTRAASQHPHADEDVVRQMPPAFGSSDSGEEALNAECQEHANKIARQNAFMSFETDTSETVPQVTIARILYNFSDACDRTSLPHELAALYSDFDIACTLPVVPSTDKVPQDVYKIWASTSVCKYSSEISEQIRFEYDRRQVWPWVHLRLKFVDRLETVHETGRYSDDDLDAVARFDYMVEGQVTPEQRRHYAKIVDLLQWPKEVSRRELILRAEPAYELELLFSYDVLLDYSSDAGPAKNIPSWRRMRELRPSSVDDALMRLYERSGEAPLV